MLKRESSRRETGCDRPLHARHEGADTAFMTRYNSQAGSAGITCETCEAAMSGWHVSFCVSAWSRYFLV